MLKNNEADEAFKELKELKEEVHKLRMEDNNKDEYCDISEEDFFSVLCRFKAKKSPMYNFLLTRA